MKTETEIRAELMERLRRMQVSRQLQSRVAGIPIARLRKLVDAGEAQRADYEALGFTDAATENH